MHHTCFSIRPVEKFCSTSDISINKFGKLLLKIILIAP